MALYDGFFDAVPDGTNEDGSPKYDREYDAEAFTSYFEQIVGSGVCIYKNPSSMQVYLQGDSAIVRPGYLFIRGYWLANAPGPGEDAETYYGYAVPLTGTGIQAVVAHLNTGEGRIDIEVRSLAQTYPDSLVLALVDTASGTVEDTRYNGDICGVIDAAGSISNKVEYAVNYIETEIENKLAQIERDIAAQEQKLDAKIAEVAAIVDKLAPPPVGSIKFSASQNVGSDWLLCDGSFVSEQNYPELVAALGKLTPSGDKFQLLSEGEIGSQITNGVVYGGRMWTYSYATKKLYGVDLIGNGSVKEIPVTSDAPYFSNFIAPSTAKPLCLSVVPHPAGGGAKLFLSQIIASGTLRGNAYTGTVLIFGGEFTGNESSLILVPPFQTIRENSFACSSNAETYIPYVVSRLENGKEFYYMMVGIANSSGINKSLTIHWSNEDEGESADAVDSEYGTMNYQRVGYSHKNLGDAVFINGLTTSGSNAGMKSTPSEAFNTPSCTIKQGGLTTRRGYGPLNVASSVRALFSFDLDTIPCLSAGDGRVESLEPQVKFPSAARVFVDAGAYLWGKDIFMIFVGTGILFSRTLEDGSFGYLDTTSVLGTITQFGYLDYSQDENTLYLLGQDTANGVKVAKMELNTLFDYANDGAWLPMIAADGVPAYIRAVDSGGIDPGDESVTVTITVLPADGTFDTRASVIFNGDALVAGTYTRTLSLNGTFTAGCRSKLGSGHVSVKLNGSTIVDRSLANILIGTDFTATFKVPDFISNGITLQGAD